MAKRTGTKGQEALGLTVKAGSCSGTGPPSPCGRVLICEQVSPEARTRTVSSGSADVVWPLTKAGGVPECQRGHSRDLFQESRDETETVPVYWPILPTPSCLSLSLSLFLLAEDAGNTGERDSEKALRSRFQIATDPKRAGGQEGTHAGGLSLGSVPGSRCPVGHQNPTCSAPPAMRLTNHQVLLPVLTNEQGLWGPAACGSRKEAGASSRAWIPATTPWRV